MNSESLSKNTLSGLLWKFLERSIADLVTIVVSVILARLLSPEDYSVTGIIWIFFGVANIFISDGLNTALIQKKDADDEDYSSVLIISLVLAIFLYVILFYSAPLIASVYRIPLLVSLIRVMSLTLVINAIKAVVCAYISNRLEFHKFFMATIVGTIISAVIGIVMALQGYGPWALVAQTMTNTVIDTVLLLIVTRMRFILRISKSRLKHLFSFGWKMFASSFINILYENLSPLIISLKYQATDLSFFTKGQMYPRHVNSIVSDTLAAVLFPVMSKMQNDRERLLVYTRSFTRISTYFLFPMMIGLLTISDSFIVILLTDKWLPASKYMKLFCLAYMFDILTRVNLQVVKALGRSDIHLILNIIKKAAYIVNIFCFLFLTDSPDRFTVVVVINSLLALVVNAIPNTKLIGYSVRMQIMDTLPSLLMAVMMGTTVYMLNCLVMAEPLKMALQIATGITVYLLLSHLLKPFGYVYGIKMIRESIGNHLIKKSDEE